MMLLAKIFKKIFNVLNLRPSSEPFISGDSFRKVADFIFDEKKSFNSKDVMKNSIVFVKADKLASFFETIHPEINASYILISHNSDENIDNTYFKYIDEKIIHWFAQNNIEYHEKITPIPIGLENLYFFQSGIPFFFKKRNLKQKITKILYGFNVTTNLKERAEALDYLRKNKNAEGIQKRINPYQYISTLKNYKYVASPPGNGFDCIRTWEALYLNVIPIVKRNYNTEFFLNIGCPLLIMDNWEELNNIDEKYLINYYNTHKIFFQSEVIFMKYWINQINTYKKHE